MLRRERFKGYGKGVRIWPMARIARPESAWLGNHVMIDDFALIIAPVTLRDYSHVCSYASLLGGEEIELGEFAGTGIGVRIMSATEDYETMTSAVIQEPFRKPYRAPVKIGRHVTIGANSVVLPGVTIGEGAVVGALSLVKTDLEPWTIYAGVPVRPIGKRDKEAVLECERRFRES